MIQCPVCQSPNPDNGDHCWQCQLPLQGGLTPEVIKVAQHQTRKKQDERARVSLAKGRPSESRNMVRMTNLVGFFTFMGWITIITTAIVLLAAIVVRSDTAASFLTGLAVVASGTIAACVFWAVAAHFEWACEMQTMQAESINILKDIRDKT